MTQKNENVHGFTHFHVDHPEIFSWVAACLRERTPPLSYSERRFRFGTGCSRIE